MPSTIDELFGHTLRGAYDDDAPWEAVRALHRLGTREVLEVAAAWCKSEDPLMRARGVDVLAQLGKTGSRLANSFPQEAYAIVSELVQEETDPRPLESGIYALGHLDNVAAVPLIAAFHKHPSADIRLSVACSLGSFPNDPLSVEILLLLMEDSDEDVRDWATFGLGVLGDLDSTAIRDALYRHLRDTSEDVREEAMVGLGKRKDLRVLSPLLSLLDGPGIKLRVAEASSFLLGMDRDPDDWGAEEYRTALQEQFFR